MSNFAAKILAVDDESTIRQVLKEFLTELGHEVLIAENGKVALELARRHSPDLILTDVLMKGMDGIELLRRVKAEKPETIVIIFTATSDENIVIEALRSGATDFIRKPFKLENLRQQIDNALKIKGVVRTGELDLNAIVREEKVLELDNDPSRIPGVVNLLTISAPKYLCPSRTRELAVALYEVLLNAIEHGNLEISFKDKSEQLGVGKYLELIDKKKSDPRLAGRRVWVDYKLDESGLYYSVRDEGPGFNWKAAQAEHGSGEVNLSAHGRGLLLAAYYVDKLTFNDKGNEINLEIYCDSYRKENVNVRNNCQTGR